MTSSTGSPSAELQEGDRPVEGCDDALAGRPAPILRTAIAGVLMGLANLVPGVSGGTMVVVMGLYDEFVSSIAEVTRLRFTRRHLLFLGVLGGCAIVTIAVFAGLLKHAVGSHRTAMFSLFIGMTLGGGPLLFKMIGKRSRVSWIGFVIGLAIMLVIAMTTDGGQRPKEGSGGAESPIAMDSSPVRDVVAGSLGMSAMVLPGISGAYMLLILGRYEAILGAVSSAKTYVVAGGGDAESLAFVGILGPVAVGAVLSIILLSNLLKWMLHHQRQLTLGILLGIVLGSVVGIWPFDRSSSASDYGLGLVLAIAGFVGTGLLSRLRA